MVDWIVPRQAEWFQQVPAALEALEKLTTPVIDRATLEELLRIHRRVAIRLMHRFGGYKAGKTFLIPRPALLRQLRRVAASETFTNEAGRKERLSAELEKIRKVAAASKIRIHVAPEVMSSRLVDLPEGVQLSPGQLTVSFSTPEQLLERLFVLAQALANDFENFRAALSKTTLQS